MKIKNFDPNRAIFLFDNIHNESSEKVVKSLVELSSESEDDIFLFINSYGGSVIALFAILDAIKSIKNNVNTIVFGEADSAAAVLSSSGIKGKRYIGENSRTMIHEVSGMVFGTISEIKNQIEGAKEMQDKLVNILSANTSKSIDEINELIDGKDFFMTAEESVNFGMADTIITSKQEEIIEELFEVSIAASGEKNISIQNCSIDKLSDFYNNIKRMIGSNYSKKDDIAKTQDVVNEDVSDTTKEIKEDEDSLINNKKKENDMSTKTDELNLNDILSRITELTNSNKDLQEKYASISNEKSKVEKESSAKIAEVNSKLETEITKNSNFMKKVKTESIDTLKNSMMKSVPAEKVTDFAKLLESNEVSTDVLNSLIDIFNSANPIVDTKKVSSDEDFANSKEDVKSYRVMKRKK